MKAAPIYRFRPQSDRPMSRQERDAKRVEEQGKLSKSITRRLQLQLRHILHSPYIRRPLFWAGTLLGILWALPLTLFGLTLALPIVLFRGHIQLIRGHTVALLARGPLADFLLHRHPFGIMTAMAIGHVVISEHQGLSSRVLVHELAHVKQAARWGILFPFAYLASSAWAVIRGKDAYWHNRFEKAARRAEKHF